MRKRNCNSARRRVEFFNLLMLLLSTCSSERTKQPNFNFNVVSDNSVNEIYSPNERINCKSTFKHSSFHSFVHIERTNSVRRSVTGKCVIVLFSSGVQHFCRRFFERCEFPAADDAGSFRPHSVMLFDAESLIETFIDTMNCGRTTNII